METSVVRAVTSLLLLITLPFSRAHTMSSPVPADGDAALASEYVMSLVLLGFTVVLSGIIYLWVLRYICIGCCQPVAVGAEPESLDGMV